MAGAPALRTDLEIMPVTKSGGTVYYVKDVQAGSLYEFSAQEYALLVLLDGQADLDQLITRFEQEHGVNLALDELQEFIGNLGEWGLLVEQQRPADAARQRSADVDVPELSEATGEDVDDDFETPVRTGRAERRGRPARYWRLFESDAFFARLAQLLKPLHGLVYALPVLFLITLGVLINNSHYIAEDITRLWKPVMLIQHMLIVLVTTNIWSKVMAGVVCRAMGGEVPGFGLTFRGISLRFEAELQGVGKLNRTQRMWLAATPLLVKVLLFCTGVLLWSMTRASGIGLAQFGFVLSAVSLIAFFLTVNPIGKSDGYALLSAYLGMPRLRHRAFGVLFSDFLPHKERQALERALRGVDARPFRIYAIASLLYAVIGIGVLLYFAAKWLEHSYSGFGVVLFLAIAAAVTWRMLSPLGRLRTKHAEEAAQILPEPLTERLQQWPHRHPKLVGGLLLFGIVSILPYPYEPGGDFELRSAHHQGVYAQTEGIVEKVYFRGGEWVAANTPIAQIASYEQEKNVSTTRAQIDEQQAQLNRLLTTPRPEEVALKKSQVETARAQADYERDEFKRQEKLYQKKTISEGDYLKAKDVMDHAVNELIEAQSDLALTMAGPHPEEIAAARAELERLRDTLRFHEEELRRTHMIMPIDGHLVTSHLDDLVGSYVEEGDLITELDDDRTMLAEIELPESDIDGVQIDALAELKIWTYPGDAVSGKVTKVDPVAVKESFGKVVKVTIEVPNREFQMKAGMTGYGKVSAGTVPTLTAFTRWLSRFFQVELWSWVP